MVFAINAPHDGDKTFDNFHKKALEFGQKEAGQSSTQAYAPTETYAPTEAYPTGSGSAPAATPTGTAGVHRVLVGDNGSLSFDPPSIAAKPQDTIVRQTQSLRKYPCVDVYANRFSNSEQRTTPLRSPLSVLLAASSSLPRM